MTALFNNFAMLRHLSLHINYLICEGNLRCITLCMFSRTLHRWLVISCHLFEFIDYFQEKNNFDKNFRCHLFVRFITYGIWMTPCSTIDRKQNQMMVQIKRRFIYTYHRERTACWAWASYQIHRIAVCACVENAGNVFPATNFIANLFSAIPQCITARAWCTCRHACRDR